MSTKYSYSVTDTANDKVDVGALTDEIGDSIITIALDYIDVEGNVLDIYFKASLSTEEQTTLDGVVAAHTGEPLPDVQDVTISNFSTLDDPYKQVQRMVVQPGRTGYYMAFRDFKLCTSKITNTFEDLRVDPTNNKRKSWGELSFVGCYSGDDTNGYTQITTEEGLANAVLSIWDFQANDQEDPSSPLDVDMMGGMFWTDNEIAETGDDRWKHQLYTMVAPNIPFLPGRLPFFDSYLFPHKGSTMQCLNTFSFPLDPSQSSEAARVRFWLYYPVGTTYTHVLGLKLYRTTW